MNLTTLLANAKNSPSGSLTSSGQSAATTSKVSASSSPLAKAQDRIQKEADSTQAQLSKIGLLKSSIAGLQTQSKTLANLPANASADAVTTAMASFFNAYNFTVTTAKSASGASEGLAGAQGARKVLTDIRRTLSADTEVSAALKKAGLKINADGTLLQDAKVFAEALTKDPSALRSALKLIGSLTGVTTDRELASTGNLETTVAGLNQRKAQLSAQQKAIKAYTS
ncbi:MAG: hypothetical protein CFE43_16995 [Burkholderiales bacterium PBB3]|nr:MAG: hypothetical protein CFE43_16995 [Burkholderiales bacterium PBB3]